MPDLFKVLLCSLYTFTNSSCSPRPLHSSLTLFSYWSPIWVQSGPLCSPCTNACLSDSIFIPCHAAAKPAFTIDRRNIPRSPCLYQPHTQSPSFRTLWGCPCNLTEGKSAGGRPLSPGQRDITCPPFMIWGTTWFWEANRSNTRSWRSRLCPLRLGWVYLGAVQGPEQTSCERSRTTLPHLICCHRCHFFVLRTRVCIILRPSNPLHWNTRIHQNLPPRHGTVLCRQVRVHPVIFLPHKDTCNFPSLCWNPPLLGNPHRCRTISMDTPPLRQQWFRRQWRLRNWGR